MRCFKKIAHYFQKSHENHKKRVRKIATIFLLFLQIFNFLIFCIFFDLLFFFTISVQIWGSKIAPLFCRNSHCSKIIQTPMFIALKYRGPHSLNFEKKSLFPKNTPPLFFHHFSPLFAKLWIDVFFETVFQILSKKGGGV